MMHMQSEGLLPSLIPSATWLFQDTVSNTMMYLYAHCCHTILPPSSPFSSSLPSPSSLYPPPLSLSSLPSLFFHPLFHPPVAPNIINKPASPDVVINSGATETITVNYNPGNPPAMVKWSKDGQLINGSSDPRVSVAPNSTILTLTNNDASIQGRYLVNVSNIGGSDTFQYNVKAVCKSFVKYIARSWDILR